MDQARKLLGKRLLRDARLGIRLHLRLQLGDLFEGPYGEHLEVADHVGVRRAEEVLIPVVLARHGGVEEERVALRLAELAPGGVEKQRESKAEGRLAAHAVDEVRSGSYVAPLVGAADLERASVVVEEMKEIVALQNLVAELGEGKRALASLQALLDALLREHLGNAEVYRYVAQELDRARSAVPVVVVHHDGGVRPVEVKDARKVLTDALLVLGHLLDGEHVALGALAARVAY